MHPLILTLPTHATRVPFASDAEVAEHRRADALARAEARELRKIREEDAAEEAALRDEEAADLAALDAEDREILADSVEDGEEIVPSDRARHAEKRAAFLRLDAQDRGVPPEVEEYCYDVPLTREYYRLEQPKVCKDGTVVEWGFKPCWEDVKAAIHRKVESTIYAGFEARWGVPSEKEVEEKGTTVEEYRQRKAGEAQRGWEAIRDHGLTDDRGFCLAVAVVAGNMYEFGNPPAVYGAPRSAWEREMFHLRESEWARVYGRDTAFAAEFSKEYVAIYSAEQRRAEWLKRQREIIIMETRRVMLRDAEIEERRVAAYRDRMRRPTRARAEITDAEITLEDLALGMVAERGDDCRATAPAAALADGRTPRRFYIRNPARDAPVDERGRPTKPVVKKFVRAMPERVAKVSAQAAKQRIKSERAALAALLR